MENVFIVSALRTPIGAFGGTLKDFTPAELGALVAREAIAKAGITGDKVGQTMFGQVVPTEPADAYLARVVAIRAGQPGSTSDDGEQALRLWLAVGGLLLPQAIKLDECEVALAGGAEVIGVPPSSRLRCAGESALAMPPWWTASTAL